MWYTHYQMNHRRAHGFEVSAIEQGYESTTSCISGSVSSDSYKQWRFDLSANISLEMLLCVYGIWKIKVIQPITETF